MKELLPDTDNFFKYLMTIGLVLIVFVIIYPVQEQKEVDIEINTYTKDTSILKYRMTRLNEDVVNFKDFQKITQHFIDSLKTLEEAMKSGERDKVYTQMQKAKEDFDTKKQHYLQLTDSLYEMNITSDAEGQKIKKLEGYFSFFKTYKIVLLVLGIIVTVIGLFYWTTAVYRDEKKKDEELRDAHISAFVRHCRWIRALLRHKIVVWILSLAIIGAIVFLLCVSIFN